MRIVDQEEVGFWVLRKIAQRNVLAVPDKIDETDSLVIKYTQKARWTAAVLDIWLTIHARGRKENAHLRFDEFRKLGRNVRWPGMAFFPAFV
jgi:hypothetical protein